MSQVVRNRQQGAELLLRWHRSGDPRWREAAIAAYMPLARRMAKRYDRGIEPLDDLTQVAYVGLVKAVDRFDPEIGVLFASYAIPTILGELRRHFRDSTWSIHVPRGMQEDMLRVRDASDQLTEQLARAPTIGELSQATGLDVERITEALQVRTAKDPWSLDQPAKGAEADSSTVLADMLGCEEEGFDLVEHRVSVAPALRMLPQRDREMLYLRFALDMTQTEIAQRMGCSQMQVSRLLRRALDRLGRVVDRPLAAELSEPQQATEESFVLTGVREPLAWQPSARGGVRDGVAQ